MNIKIDWAARTLDINQGNFYANHYFVLISWTGNFSLPMIHTLSENNRNFVTLGAFPENEGEILNLENMIFKANHTSDVLKARVLLNGSGTDSFSSFRNEVSPPTDSPSSFAKTLTRMAFHYRQHSSQHPINYEAVEPSSNSWVNSLFKAAGVCDDQLSQLRDFRRLDIAEHLEFRQSILDFEDLVLFNSYH